MPNGIKISCSMHDAPDCAELKRLEPVHQELLKARKKMAGFDTRYEFVTLPFDLDYYQHVQACAQKKRAFNCTAIVVIGIGGSGLGVRAVHEALHGLHWNELNQPRVYFADTLDAHETQQIYTLVQSALEAGERILLVVISKTGATLESVAHFCMFLSLVQRFCPADYREYVIIISDDNSKLAQYARKENFDTLPIPEPIGGRYSVFTAVGIFVLAVLGADIEQLCNGARAAVDQTLDSPLEHNDAALSARAIYQQYQQGTVILDYFVFSKTCAGLGQWYRQLIGESLGKKTARGTYCGLTPTVSVGSNDLHAVAQLYLGGHPPVFTQFLTINGRQPELIVPACAFDNQLTDYSYATLMNILFQATKSAYDEQKRPYLHVQLADSSAYTIGYLLQFYMLQVVYLAALFEVNPFDQPQVELYKKHARRLLDGC